MSDIITKLCELTAEILQENPQAEMNQLVELVKQGITVDSHLGTAIQGDRQLIQINEGKAKGFQTLVLDGVNRLTI